MTPRQMGSRFANQRSSLIVSPAEILAAVESYDRAHPAPQKPKPKTPPRTNVMQSPRVVDIAARARERAAAQRASWAADEAAERRAYHVREVVTRTELAGRRTPAAAAAEGNRKASRSLWLAGWSLDRIALTLGVTPRRVAHWHAELREAS